MDEVRSDENNIAVGRRTRSHSKKSLLGNGGLLFIDNQIADLKDDAERKEYYTTECSNLLGLIKLVVNELIEISMKKNRMLDVSHSSFENLFVLLELILRHGLKSKRGLLSVKKDLWNLIEAISLSDLTSAEIVASVKSLPNAKTSLGKCRAWLRLAFLQKRLPEYFKFLLDSKDTLLKEYYEDGAVMLSDKVTVVGGLLIGLNIIDCSWCAKDEDLDARPELIDLTNYLRDNVKQINEDTAVAEPQSNIETVLNQKNYIEELNRHLSATVVDLQKKLECCKLERRSENTYSEANSTTRPILSFASDENGTAGETPPNTAALDEHILVEEVKKRQRLEKELEEQLRVKNEIETAMKLLEKDIHEKQDTIISLRRQLEDIKAINIQMYNKLKECETLLKSKSVSITQLERENMSLNSTVLQLETRLLTAEEKCVTFEETNQKLTKQAVERDQRRITLEGDLRKERESRIGLQSIVDSQQAQITSLQNHLEEALVSREDYDALRKEHRRLQKLCAEYELSLEEVGCQLRNAKLETDSLKETSGMMKDAMWTKDKDVTNCTQCAKPFSVSRRRHHCRNCGKIFCAPCSDNKLPLPSSAHPVRVCDQCHPLLLERYSVT